MTMHRPPLPSPERHPCLDSAWAEQLARLIQAKRCQHGAEHYWDELGEAEKVQLREAALAVLDMINLAMSATDERTEAELFDLLRGDWPAQVMAPHVARHEAWGRGER